MKEIIAFIGFSGSGKSFFANEIIRIDNEYSIIRFSERVESIVAKCVNEEQSRKENENWWEEFKFKEFSNNNIKFTGRNIMNSITEEIIRIDNDFWYKEWENRIKNYNKVIVTDLRYTESIKYLFNENYLTKIYFTSFKSERFKIQEGKTEDLVSLVYHLSKEKIKEDNKNGIYKTDVTDTLRALVKIKSLTDK